MPHAFKSKTPAQAVSPQHWHTHMPAGAVRAIFSAIDFSKDGSADILVGRDDGSVELYGMDTEQQPTLLWSINVSESVSSIQGGFITSPSTQVRGAARPQGRPAQQEALCIMLHMPHSLAAHTGSLH